MHDPPLRTIQQRSSALQRANHIRTFRKLLKKDLKAGRRHILEVLQEPPDETETMKIFDLLMSTPKYGRVKVNRLLSLCRISTSKTIGGLSERQRNELVSLIRRRHPRM